MITAILLAFALVILTFALHYRVFTILATYTPRLPLSPYMQMMMIILTIFSTHLLEIGMYAATYGWVLTS